MTNGQTQSQFVTGFAVPSQGSNAIQSEEDGEEEKKFEATLQPAGMINRGLESGFGANGNDPLTAGHVEVESQVEVQLTGAAANVTYTVQFCRFGVGTSGCLSLGSVSTDAMGNAQAEVGFPAMGTFDSVFILTRMENGQMLNEFVTASAFFSWTLFSRIVLSTRERHKIGRTIDDGRVDRGRRHRRLSALAIHLGRGVFACAR